MYLLDTHVLIWFRISPNDLGKRTLRLLKNPTTPVTISVISDLEVAQLVYSGRLVLPCDTETWMGQGREIFQAPVTDISARIAAEAYRLPEPFHRDPADRILVTTARLQSWTLMTADKRLLGYSHVRTMNAKR